jgi:tRNA splicing ligase
MLRHMRGLIYSYDKPGDASGVKLISRGFEKFFNANELPENTYDALRSKYGHNKYEAREKADGHMIEYFVDKGKLFATTRGKLGTASAEEALTMFSLEDFNSINKCMGGNLMTLVVELVTPNTEVHVNYNGSETLYLLAAYDTSGNKFDVQKLSEVARRFKETFSIPAARRFTVDEMINEINRREVQNNEGWVMDFDGQLIKFKYISYIGKMVESKLSYKYIMNCIRNNRLDKMLFTLPEEIRAHAYQMVATIQTIASQSSTYKPLYELYSDREGGESYFRTVCRGFWKDVYTNTDSSTQKSMLRVA